MSRRQFKNTGMKRERYQGFAPVLVTFFEGLMGLGGFV
jgi:hypothetical protein